MKRMHTEIKGYDYTTKEEYEMHIVEMEDKGWTLLGKHNFGGYFQHGVLEGSEKWQYVAYFMRIKE